MGSSIGRAYPFQQVAHEGDIFPISWLLVDTHAFVAPLVGEPPLGPCLRDLQTIFGFELVWESVRAASTLPMSRLFS